MLAYNVSAAPAGPIAVSVVAVVLLVAIGLFVLISRGLRSWGEQNLEQVRQAAPPARSRVRLVFSLESGGVAIGAIIGVLLAPSGRDAGFAGALLGAFAGVVVGTIVAGATVVQNAWRNRGSTTVTSETPE